ncbi:MAG: 1-acyl-sn-glycerol-3-phosphate acyltransferase [bacterium]
MTLITQPLTSAVDLVGEPSAPGRPWYNWIAFQSRKAWVLPHAERRFDAIAYKNITVFTAPIFPRWLAHLLRNRFLLEGWPAPRHLLTTGNIFKRQADSFSSIRNDPVFFLELGIDRKHSLTAKDWIVQLLEDCAIRSKTLQFIPLIFLWNRSPNRQYLYPLYGFIRHRHHNVISTGFPKTIQPGITMEIPSAEAIRRELLAAWNQESRCIIGDKKEPVRKIIQTIQSEPVLQNLLENLAAQGKDTLPTLQSRVAAYVREIAADYSHVSPWLWEKVLAHFLKNNFSSLDFDHEGLDELRILLRKRNIVILTPTHRSHLDYIFISFAIYKQGLACPLVAAGQNLSFWPMGYVFRKTGAFFIRRTFRGLDIYPHVFRSYLWMVLRKFQPVEFFIEGGRSRTGALLPAKLGMLNMIIDAFIAGKLKDVKFVPVAVNYDRIVEEDSYIRELKGLPKQTERISSLFKSRHLLKRHFGNVCFAVGKPVSLAETLSTTGSQTEQKDMLGMEIMNNLRLTMPITSTALVATVLMADNPHHWISSAEIIAGARDLLRLIEAVHPNANIAREFSDKSKFDAVLQSALMRMRDFDNIIPAQEPDKWKLNENRRFQVDYLRNSIISLLLAPALVIIRPSQDWSSPESIRLMEIFCPGIHPIPTRVLKQEIDLSISLSPGWSIEQKSLLTRTISPVFKLIQNIQTAITSKNIDLKTVSTELWDDIFHQALDRNSLQATPEICTTVFVRELFKAFRQRGGEPFENNGQPE